MRGIDDVALAFDAACREAGVSYAFAGPMAVMVWGEPRATTGIDAMAEVSASSSSRFVTSLRAQGFTIDPRDLEDSLRDGSHVSIFAEDSVFWVDLKVAQRPAERREVAEAVEAPVRGARLRIVGPEETVAFKLKFGSPKDLQGATSILVRQKGRMSDEKLAALCDHLGVTEPLARLRSEIARLSGP